MAHFKDSCGAALECWAFGREERSSSTLPDVWKRTSTYLSHDQRNKPRGCCQVQSCSKPLDDDNAFLKRCRICSYHASALFFMFEGKPSRFCNLCKKPQDVREFEGSRRSCREALEKHNARRRLQRSKNRKLQIEAGGGAAGLSRGEDEDGEDLSPILQLVPYPSPPFLPAATSPGSARVGFVGEIDVISGQWVGWVGGAGGRERKLVKGYLAQRAQQELQAQQELRYTQQARQELRHTPQAQQELWVQQELRHTQQAQQELWVQQELRHTQQAPQELQAWQELQNTQQAQQELRDTQQAQGGEQAQHSHHAWVKEHWQWAQQGEHCGCPEGSGRQLGGVGGGALEHSSGGMWRVQLRGRLDGRRTCSPHSKAQPWLPQAQALCSRLERGAVPMQGRDHHQRQTYPPPVVGESPFVMMHNQLYPSWSNSPAQHLEAVGHSLSQRADCTLRALRQQPPSPSQRVGQCKQQAPPPSQPGVEVVAGVALPDARMQPQPHPPLHPLPSLSDWHRPAAAALSALPECNVPLRKAPGAEMESGGDSTSVGCQADMPGGGAARMPQLDEAVRGPLHPGTRGITPPGPLGSSPPFTATHHQAGSGGSPGPSLLPPSENKAGREEGWASSGTPPWDLEELSFALSDLGISDVLLGSGSLRPSSTTSLRTSSTDIADPLSWLPQLLRPGALQGQDPAPGSGAEGSTPSSPTTACPSHAMPPSPTPPRDPSLSRRGRKRELSDQGHPRWVPSAAALKVPREEGQHQACATQRAQQGENVWAPLSAAGGPDVAGEEDGGGPPQLAAPGECVRAADAGCASPNGMAGPAIPPAPGGPSAVPPRVLLGHGLPWVPTWEGGAAAWSSMSPQSHSLPLHWQAKGSLGGHGSGGV